MGSEIPVIRLAISLNESFIWNLFGIFLESPNALPLRGANGVSVPCRGELDVATTPCSYPLASPLPLAP